MGWIFTIIITLGNPGEQPMTQPKGPFATQQACEVQRVMVVDKMPGLQTTPCTQEASSHHRRHTAR